MQIARKVSALLSAAAFIAVVTVNALANILPINGVGTGQLSDEIPNLFVPAGLTFAVWGLIYLLLLIYVGVVLAAGFAFSRGAADWRSSWSASDGWIFSLNMAANAAWIFVWHYRLIVLSLAIMLAILVSLIWLEEKAAVRSREQTELVGWRNKLGRLALSVPINVYLGWICVATIANVTAVLVTGGWDGFGLDPRIWTVAVIGAGVAVALALAIRRHAVAAPLVVAWAYVGIVLKRTAIDPEYSAPVWFAAMAAVALLIGLPLLVSAMRSYALRRQKTA